ncbi:arginyltransferase [Sulfurospirillum sp. T05]|uniref:Aspartate/glutamate leucyltransferase n=1 Tax=Sulfurospirillum tamanense TaxID=2813362 RepID=A0ABS2WUF6_9BACT|nr:arginyltransferase [Sulfurospirillum tamanensis]
MNLTSTVDFSTLETTCAYLPNQNTRMQYKFIKGANAALSSALTQRGWRRFGEYYSRPQCAGCEACLSLRIDAQKFEFSKNAKRVFRKNASTRIYIRPPSVTAQHLDLYNRYHALMKEKRGWKHYHLSAQSYYELYVAGHGTFGHEILYFVDQKLVGVDLVDILEDGLSSIYFFYDPDFAHLSLGRYSLYQQILLCQRHHLRWVYLGYYVKECQSLRYKGEYTPYQILQGLPSLNQEPFWR